MSAFDILAPQLRLNELIWLARDLGILEEYHWQVGIERAGLNCAKTADDAQYYRRRLNEAEDLRDKFAEQIIVGMKMREAERE